LTNGLNSTVLAKLEGAQVEFGGLLRLDKGARNGLLRGNLPDVQNLDLRRRGGGGSDALFLCVSNLTLVVDDLAADANAVVV
jgi:hypothetical protein